MVIEFVVLDERDRRIDGFFGRRHIDRAALPVVVDIFHMRARRVSVQFLLGHDLRAEPHRATDDQSETDLPDDLVPAAEPFLVLAKHLDVVVQETDQSEPDGRNDHQPRINVGQVAEQQRRDQNRNQDNNAAHRRRSAFLQLSFEAEVAHLLADLLALQETDDPAAENHSDRQRQNNRHRRTERQRQEHPRTGNVEMQ